jgi:inner membrane protein
MIIGHLPAGYITSKLLFPYFEKYSVSYKGFFFWGMFGSVAPDLDMFYFYFIDHRQHHHHTYFTHYPIVWFSLLTASLLWLRLAPKNPNPSLAIIFTLGGFIHMLLDTIVGDIWWFAPFYNKPFALATVPAIYHPWWLNFFLHWSFGLEILVIIWAIYLWRQKPQPALIKCTD